MIHYNPPIFNSAFKCRITLNAADGSGIKVNPTIAAGDFQITRDGAALTNLNTPPSASPASSEFVLLELSASEMSGSIIAIKGVDQTDPKEWEDFSLCILTVG